MIIGLPKEIKNNEFRVACTPSAVLELTKLKHIVFVQSGAGYGSGFKDEEYRMAGANIVDDPHEIYSDADLIVKVKEPQASEYPWIRKGQMVFTYFHFASSKELTEAMIQSGSVCLAYETVSKEDGLLPLLVPMSEVAGRMSVLQAAKYLEKPQGGMGKIICGLPGVKPAKVLIIGGGTVGMQAAKMAAGLGADVCVMDVNIQRLRYLEDILPKNVKTLAFNDYVLRQEALDSDVIIGAVLIAGAKAPKLIPADWLKKMKPGTVLVDVAIDQGGCFETSRPTTHADPVYEIDGILHYCVANMPGAVPQSSTQALSNVTIPYIKSLATHGWEKAASLNPEIARGLNIAHGQVLNKSVADAFGFTHISWEDLKK
ncbi:MAG: alanine dehydrogenase [Cytophagales bacterium]|nr:alanine dehydrogenase [Cytophagales bacterium]